MITEQNKIFACIQDALVTWIFTSIQLPEYNENDIQVVECDANVQAGWTYINDVFVPPIAHLPIPVTLFSAKASRLAKLKVDCQKTILGGFEYGGWHYPFQLTDQANLTGCVVASLLPINATNPDWRTPFWSATDIGALLETDQGWGFVEYSASEIQAIGNASVTFKLTAMNQLVGLTALVVGADTNESVSVVTWIDRETILN